MVHFHHALALASLLVVLDASPGQEPVADGNSPLQKNLRPSELSKLLTEPVNVDDLFKNPMSLQEFLVKLTEYYRIRKGMEVLFRIDQNAFKEENPDAPDTAETPVTIQSPPRKRSGAQLLHHALAQVATQNAAFLVRPGYVEITTYERTRAGSLLSQRIHVRIERRPLHLALEDLFDQTGVPIVLDTRVGNLARMPVNLHIAKETPLGTVLVLITTMTNLRLVVIEDVIFVTTPALAEQMLWQYLRRSYFLPDWSNEYPQRVEAA